MRYEPSWSVLLFWIPAIIIGYLLHLHSQNQHKAGKIRGVRRSRGVLDYLLGNRDDYE